MIYLFDDQGKKQDKFSIRLAKQGNSSYIVRTMAFSPGSHKLVMAQYDNIVLSTNSAQIEAKKV